jgi:hypothetical protein
MSVWARFGSTIGGLRAAWLRAAWQRVEHRYFFSDEAGARMCVLVAVGLMLAVNIPMLAVGTVFGGDDWAWQWVYRVQGSAAMHQYLWEVVHPGFAPVFDIVLSSDPESTGRAARVFAIVFHLANGWLVWLIFRDGRIAPAFAAIVAVLYLAAPFNVGLRGSPAHVVYDVFIFFYLFSIWISARQGPLAMFAAVVAMLMALSIETLIALEPMRWWLIYRRNGSVRDVFRRAWPFFVIIVAFSIVRVTWMKPTGHYEGYNEFRRLKGHEYGTLLLQHLRFFANLMEPARLAALLVRQDSSFVALVLAAGSGAVALLLRHAKREPSDKDLTILFIVGAVVLGAGMLPYIAIGRTLSRVDFDARFAVASQFGALILIAVAIFHLRFNALRIAAVAGLVFVFAGLQLQMTKWMLHEQLVFADFHRQLTPYLARSIPQILVVKFTPPTNDFIFLRRSCWSSYDNNAALDLAGKRNGSMVYDEGCGAKLPAPSGDCRILAFDHARPCPAVRKTAEFQLNPGMDRFGSFRLADLAHRALAGSPLDAGKLVIHDGDTASPPSVR